MNFPALSNSEVIALVTSFLGFGTSIWAILEARASNANTLKLQEISSINSWESEFQSDVAKFQSLIVEKMIAVSRSDLLQKELNPSNPFAMDQSLSFTKFDSGASASLEEVRKQLASNASSIFEVMERIRMRLDSNKTTETEFSDLLAEALSMKATPTQIREAATRIIAQRRNQPKLNQFRTS